MVAALVPASIKKKGFVSAAMDASYPPDEFVAANGTTIIGMDADFNAALGAVMGIKWKGVNATFGHDHRRLRRGKFDVGNSSFTVTKASREAGQLRHLLPGRRGLLRGQVELAQAERAA